MRNKVTINNSPIIGIIEMLSLKPGQLAEVMEGQYKGEVVIGVNSEKISALVLKNGDYWNEFSNIKVRLLEKGEFITLEPTNEKMG